MTTNTQPLADLPCHTVIRELVGIVENVGDPLALDQRLEEARPALERAAIVECARLAPIKLIAQRQVDAMGGRAGRLECVS